ncbi:MAG TPA: methyltransferase domain-containing protein [Solirubrobacteraceae bacterium]|nr:methyltransferase domain-containing protein [Solirubrobacteraceae bacterium]
MVRAASPKRAAARARPVVIWHDLECGLYTADLELWRELARAHAAGGEPILEIGAGTGRVSIDLARRGHAVTALERDPILLAALAERATGLDVAAVGGDARAFKLARSDYALCLVPMQTVQLMGGRAGRLAFLRAVRAHMCDRGVLACALVEEIEPFDADREALQLEPELARHEGVLYSSRPTRVSVGRWRIRIELERHVERGDQQPGAEPQPGVEPDPGEQPEREVIELDRLTAERLQQEAALVGLRALEVRSVSPTELHTASTVVILGA